MIKPTQVLGETFQKPFFFDEISIVSNNFITSLTFLKKSSKKAPS